MRIGINLGEVIVEGDDRYGEGVNIAARLQQLAEPGGICVSGRWPRRLRGSWLLPSSRWASRGSRTSPNQFRHIAYCLIRRRPAACSPSAAAWRFPVGPRILVFALGLAAAWWQPWESRQLSQPEASDSRPSLVVLPFDNLSDDKEQEYLANGFTEDLTTELARVPGLFVVSRNAAFAYKDKDDEAGGDCGGIGRPLHAGRLDPSRR